MKSLRKIEQKLKQKKSRKSFTKVNYPWLKRCTSRKAKSYMAFLIDNDPEVSGIPTSARLKKKFFSIKIYKKVKHRFPKLYGKVKRYYNDRGKSLTKDHFKELLYARLVNMYEKGFKIKTQEHPLKSKNEKLKADYRSHMPK